MVQPWRFWIGCEHCRHLAHQGLLSQRPMGKHEDSLAWLHFHKQAPIGFQKRTEKAYTFIALKHYVNSCCLVWPCTFKHIARANLHLVVPDKQLSSPMLIPVTSLLSYDVWQYKFRSYLGMWFGFPQARTQFQPGILLI